MPYFAVYALDRPAMRERRGELRAPHRDWLRRHDHPVSVHIGGPLLDDGGEMIGTLLVIEAEEKSAVERYLAADPYCRADLFASMDIRRFNWGLGQPAGAHG